MGQRVEHHEVVDDPLEPDRVALGYAGSDAAIAQKLDAVKQERGQAHFDCRVVVAPADEQVTDYFRWRRADAARCALNG